MSAHSMHTFLSFMWTGSHGLGTHSCDSPGIGRVVLGDQVRLQVLLWQPVLAVTRRVRGPEQHGRR